MEGKNIKNRSLPEAMKPMRTRNQYNIVLMVAGCVSLALLTLAGGAEAPPPKLPDHLINDPTRPVYHLVSQSKRSHIADPNFAFYWKGRYHLFYITVRNGVTKKRNFAHVSSTDMVHWKHHPETNFNPLSPPSDPVQRRLQSPPAKSNFLAVPTPTVFVLPPESESIPKDDFGMPKTKANTLAPQRSSRWRKASFTVTSPDWSLFPAR
jgi:hypothetical protein